MTLQLLVTGMEKTTPVTFQHRVPHTHRPQQISISLEEKASKQETAGIKSAVSEDQKPGSQNGL